MEGVQSYFYTDNEVRSMEALLAYHEKRSDGREKDEVRIPIFEFSINSAIVHLGSTLVSCSTTAEIIRPNEDRPSEGLHLLSLQSPNRIHKSFQTEALVQIRDCLHRTRALDLESLVIKIGEQVWCLKSDIVILNNDGGLFEAVNLAVIGSLLHTKLPGPRGPRPIVLHHLPIAVTFGYLNLNRMPGVDRNQPYIQPLCFVDPTYLETLALDGLLTIFSNAQGEICAIHKNDGIPLSSFVFPSQTDSHINMAIEISLAVAKKWHSALMHQMGKNAPPSLAKLGEEPVKSQTEESSQIEAQTSKTDIKEIENEVLQEFREVAEEEENEEISPDLLDLFS
ncbi:nucleolar autoantigen-like protein [Tritrichomonas foetus]|uniref:Nucleolar autoantigen-like protein n=1 Tax=Tritrichomonas foetus TaxID=1144522 RepID=A0A1J4KFX2_9EUKA|nr:nucleolar autoantigen-like protein [Tritrichomonas foetus]|eukprot:OHT08245.1 nucleolar autoantigen-like protein [Tritrichomonas foetus]